MPQTYGIFTDELTGNGYIANYDESMQPIGDPIYQLPGALSGWAIKSNTLYNLADPFGNPTYRLGPEGTNFLEISENGTVRVQYGNTFDYINQGTSLNLEYGVAATVDITTAEGEQFPYSLAFAKLGKTGTRWAVATDKLGNESFHQVRADLTLSQLQSQSSVWTRWASPREVATRAVTSRLWELSRSTDPVDRDLFNQLLTGMGITRDQFESEGSGAIDAWVQAASVSMSAAARVTFVP